MGTGLINLAIEDHRKQIHTLQTTLQERELAGQKKIEKVMRDHSEMVMTYLTSIKYHEIEIARLECLVSRNGQCAPSPTQKNESSE